MLFNVVASAATFDDPFVECCTKLGEFDPRACGGHDPRATNVVGRGLLGDPPRRAGPAVHPTRGPPRIVLHTQHMVHLLQQFGACPGEGGGRVRQSRRLGHFGAGPLEKDRIEKVQGPGCFRLLEQKREILQSPH